jgi:endogenous inhibitor of DNA gyrase (YacG/DUF329 family)
MEGASTAEWPQLPFCSERCRLIDLGRWLDERYRVEAEAEGEGPPHRDDAHETP